MHLLLFFSPDWPISVTWLSLLYKFTQIFIYFSLWRSVNALETLDSTIRIGSTPTFLYFDLYLYPAYAAHYVYYENYLYLSVERCFCLTFYFMYLIIFMSVTFFLPGVFDGQTNNVLPEHLCSIAWFQTTSNACIGFQLLGSVSFSLYFLSLIFLLVFSSMKATTAIFLMKTLLSSEPMHIPR